MSTFDEFATLLKIKRYAPNTIQTYIGLLVSFQKYLGDSLPLHRLEQHHLKQKVIQLIQDRNYAYATQKQLTSAIKLYLELAHYKYVSFDRIAPRKPQRILPDILSQQEVNRMFERTQNLKHRAMLMTTYALGLRSGELTALHIVNLDGDRNMIFIKAAKGKKDRNLPFPDKLKKTLRLYYKEYKPTNYLFEGRHGKQYTTTSLRKVFSTAVQRAGITKKVSLHSLRHAYATHLLEAGTDIRVIQKMLGHNSIKTTMLYTHVAQTEMNNVPSPLDFL
ncbi:tyrosine-type recombinase/integrase [Lacinutrix sp.]|uniref:tyrosine-type recombinase/integrase n=1 Tax=Lacinutrix sp. TaxID=1937692 RepID=UPI0025BE3DB0|nr:tyrosine-type recombinase/integrase [Lacinutrix sp.]